MVPSNFARRAVRGFTLIELLVVVAIIALLISILLPSLSRAKQQARQLVCLTNLKSIGDATRFYGNDHKDWQPRGIMGIYTPGPEYHIFSTAILGYLGWKGEVQLVTGPNDRLWDLTGDTNKLFGGESHVVPVRVLNAVLRKFELYHCPDYPFQGPDRTEEQPGVSPLDYVASAMPIPYTQNNYNHDNGGMEWDPTGEGQPEDYNNYDSNNYISQSKLESFPARTNPASATHVTEVNQSVAWKYGGNPTGPRFHHFFIAMQLPFGGRPRIADDQRHPSGLNCLFFDGHAATIDIHQLDVGYPYSHARRLKYFSVMFDGYTE